MANNPFIYNGALQGATGGIHERWITATDEAEYLAVRTAIIEFANTVDALIPTDPDITIADSSLMQSITQGVLASRYVTANDEFAPVAQAIVALWQALRTHFQPFVIVITTDDVINESDVPGATLTDALDDVQQEIDDIQEEIAPATGSEPGYRTRLLYVNAASTRVGTTHLGVEVQAAPAGWLTEEDVPPGDNFDIVVIAAGGGGCGGMSGVTGSSFSAFGAPGGGGGRNRLQCKRADIIEALPILFTIGLGGDGSAGSTSSAVGNVTDTDIPATAGSPGGNAFFGTLCQAFGGGGGMNRGSTTGVSNGAGGGGIQSAGSSGGAGGGPGGATGSTAGVGGAGNGTSAGTNGGNAWTGGGAGGNGNSPPSAQGVGGGSMAGAGGGGAGATFNISDNASANGGNGGTACNYALAGGVGGTSVAGSAVLPSVLTGGDGNDGNDATIWGYGGSGGGGGGSAKNSPGSAYTNQRVALGGNGGDGGFPGGGAGGGAGAGCGTPSSGPPAGQGTATGGTGGRGGDAAIFITID